MMIPPSFPPPGGMINGPYREAAAPGAGRARCGPGPRTEGTERFGGQLTHLAAVAPAGRPAAPEEIAAAAGFLAGSEAAFLHGAVPDMDGGRNATQPPAFGCRRSRRGRLR